MKLNRYTIGTVALKQETFSVRSMTEDATGSITVQTAVVYAVAVQLERGSPLGY
jgi:hypothetical protein